MPTLRHLLEELGLLGVEPEDVRIPGKIYDDIVDNADTSENPNDEK